MSNPHTVYIALQEARDAFTASYDEDTAIAARWCTTPSMSLATRNAWDTEIAATLAWLQLPWYERACVEWQRERGAA